ncbi:DUF397 domain-containing protein [Streptomyces bauhiniae]|uniref:DUF397 domain-containing protein n=1 Tax=Streptomyces bauhiniae TaxID=2340725 RepID=A0A7K3QTE0_9ACTN|nr:DUF397 domain-containing protein [Streptomyces bauhiniae]NEB93146.1 DUF397 domain-containing protein [Streptomyces bauhiniae]
MQEYDLTNALWHKSSYNNGEGGDCVEVADGILVRDSKVKDGAVLLLSDSAWAGFLDTLRY